MSSHINDYWVVEWYDNLQHRMIRPDRRFDYPEHVEQWAKKHLRQGAQYTMVHISEDQVIMKSND